MATEIVVDSVKQGEVIGRIGPQWIGSGYLTGRAGPGQRLRVWVVLTDEEVGLARGRLLTGQTEYIKFHEEVVVGVRLERVVDAAPNPAGEVSPASA